MNLIHKQNHATTWKSLNMVVKGYFHEKFYFFNTSSTNTNLGQEVIIQASYCIKTIDETQLK